MQQYLGELKIPSDIPTLEHSEYGGSSAHRWMTCPASISESRKCAANPFADESYAAEGTLAHEIARLALFPFNFTMLKRIPGEIIMYAQIYATYVRGIAGENTLSVEKRVDYSKLVPGGFGTVDAYFTDKKTDTLHIFDFKYGQGVEVFAKENKQLLTYAAGVYLQENGARYKTWILHIIQPRIKQPEHYEINRDRLRAHMDEMRDMYTESISEKPKYNPSPSACRWCPALLSCPAARLMMEGIMGSDLLPPALDKFQLTAVKNKKVMFSYIAQAENRIKALLMFGRSVPGFSLKKKNKRKTWIPQAENILKMMIGDKAFNKKLKGSTDIKHILPTGVVDALREKPPSNELELIYEPEKVKEYPF